MINMMSPDGRVSDKHGWTDLGDAHLFVGKTMAEAFQAMYTLETACQAQVAALSGGAEVILVGKDVLDTVAHAVSVQRSVLSTDEIFATLKRKLDRRNPGYEQ